VRQREHYGREIAAIDAYLEAVASEFPESEALEVLHGIGRFLGPLQQGRTGRAPSEAL